VDRTLTSDEKENFQKTHWNILPDEPVVEERLKFDSRISEDEKPISLNEYALEYVSRLS